MNPEVVNLMLGQCWIVQQGLKVLHIHCFRFEKMISWVEHKIISHGYSSSENSEFSLMAEIGMFI